MYSCGLAFVHYKLCKVAQMTRVCHFSMFRVVSLECLHIPRQYLKKIFTCAGRSEFEQVIARFILTGYLPQNRRVGEAVLLDHWTECMSVTAKR